MTMMLNINEKYLSEVEHFIASLPQGAVEIANSLDDEILKRISEYKNNPSKTVAFEDGLKSIRERLVSKS